MWSIQRVVNDPLARVRPGSFRREEGRLAEDHAGFARPERGEPRPELSASAAASLPALVRESEDPGKYATYRLSGRAATPSPPMGMLLDVRG
jgi:hypothetical protein